MRLGLATQLLEAGRLAEELLLEGADRLAEWEGAGEYLGWRIGITAAGEWIFLVAGD